MLTKMLKGHILIFGREGREGSAAPGTIRILPILDAPDTCGFFLHLEPSSRPPGLLPRRLY